ncbi:MAG: hypothetical protein K2M95_06805 [Clostridiales bacterium]|nr:hypothetical protein [Clostridiales bacterium]
MTRSEKTIFAGFGAATVGLLALCVFSPFLSIALFPVAVVLLYYAGARTKWWLLLLAGALYAGAGLLFRGVNLFLLTGAVLTLSLGAVAAFRKKLPPLAESAICAGVCLLVTCATVGVFALVFRTGLTNVITRAIAKCDTDPVTAFLSQRFYRKQTEESLGHLPLTKGDELYASEALTEYAHSIGRLLENETLWYVSGFGAFVGILSPFCTFAFLQAGKRGDVAVRVETLRLGHGYLKAVVLPVLVFSLLGFYEPLSSAVRTVFNVFITIPTAFCGISLLFYVAKLFHGKARIASIVVFWLLMATAAVFWEWGLIVLGFLGIADIIINVRKLLDWALS